VKIGQPWRPVGEVKKRKEHFKKESQTVIFHACAETPTQPDLSHIWKLRKVSPT